MLNSGKRLLRRHLTCRKIENNEILGANNLQEIKTRLEGGLRIKGFFKNSSPDLPLVSIITVVRNGETYLEETIKSVINQKYDNVEYILIDGGSTDKTLDIITKYENYIDYWVSGSDEGIYDAMNKGINIASGDWLYFLNCRDTFVDALVLKEIVVYLKATELSLVVGQVNAVKNSIVVDEFPHSNGGKISARNLFKSHFCHQAMFIKKESYIENCLFSTKFKFFNDFLLIYKILKNEGNFLNVSLIIANFDLSGISNNWKYSIELFEESEKIMKELGEGLSTPKYYVYLLKAHLYKFKMFIKYKVENIWIY